MGFLDTVVLGNSVRAWALAIAAVVLLTLALRFIQNFLERRLDKIAAGTKNTVDDLIADLAHRTKLWFLILEAAFAVSIALKLSPATDRFLQTLAILALLIQGGYWTIGVLDYIIRTRLDQERQQQDAVGTTTVSAMGYIARVTIWVVVLLLVLQNAGVEVTALIASLGVGGVAVALALQNILGDLFASLAMILDKPFVIGDFIIVNDYMGTVEKIGLKTTRVRSLSGEQIVFSNSDLLNSRVRNYKRMFERRVLFSFGVTYDTTPDVLAQIGGWVREIVEAQENTRFDRAHFSTFGDSSLNFEVVYYVLDSDYNVYMDIQQEINLELMRKLADAQVEFAFPTRTVYLEGSAAPSVSAS